MKHLMTLLALVVAVTAGAQTEWPWNPDSDSDNVIGTVDLLSLLTVYGFDFYVELPVSEESLTTAALVKKEGFTDAFGCMTYCSSIGGFVPSTEQLSYFGDAILELPPTYGGSWETYYILTKESHITNNPHQFKVMERGAGPTSHGANADGWFGNSWNTYQNADPNDSDHWCFCIGQVPNPEFSGE